MYFLCFSSVLRKALQVKFWMISSGSGQCFIPKGVNFYASSCFKLHNININNNAAPPSDCWDFPRVAGLQELQPRQSWAANRPSTSSTHLWYKDLSLATLSKSAPGEWKKLGVRTLKNRERERCTHKCLHSMLASLPNLNFIAMGLYGTNFQSKCIKIKGPKFGLIDTYLWPLHCHSPQVNTVFTTKLELFSAAKSGVFMGKVLGQK